jgi:hypothetical protein
VTSLGWNRNKFSKRILFKNVRVAWEISAPQVRQWEYWLASTLRM